MVLSRMLKGMRNDDGVLCSVNKLKGEILFKIDTSSVIIISSGTTVYSFLFINPEIKGLQDQDQENHQKIYLEDFLEE